MTRLVRRWGDAAIDRANQLRNAITKLITTPPTTHKVDVHITVTPEITASMERKRSGTDDKRITQLENDYNDLVNKTLRELDSSLRAEINEAIATELQAFKAESDKIRLLDICPALAGIVVSITGYVVQLLC